MQLGRSDRGSMNPDSISTKTQWQFRPKPKLATAWPIENETRPKVNFLPILVPKPKPKLKFGRPLSRNILREVLWCEQCMSLSWFVFVSLNIYGSTCRHYGGWDYCEKNAALVSSYFNAFFANVSRARCWHSILQVTLPRFIFVLNEC